MKVLAGQALTVALVLCPALAWAAAAKVVIHDFDHLAMAPNGARIADVEADDPGNLPDEPHGHVTVRDASGKILATYDPCKTCKYSDTAFSPKGEALAFLASDEKVHRATLYAVTKGKPRVLANMDGVANTLRWSPDGARLALLATFGAHKKTGAPLSSYPRALPPELEPLTTKPLLAVVNGPSGIDLKLEAELAELPDEEAEAFRDGGASALDEIAGRLRDALDLITFFTAGEKDTRAWTLRNGESALDAAAAIHTDIARGFIRCEVIDWRDLVDAGSHAEVARRGLQRLEGKTYVVRDGDVLNIRFNI